MRTLLFDPVNGIGLTMLRIGIDGTSGSPNIMGVAAYADGQACVKYAGSACKVWAAPWSPPAGDKDNNVNNGGHLLTTDYASWAKVLAAFPAYYKANGGVDLYAISAQNEPDFRCKLPVVHLQLGPDGGFHRRAGPGARRAQSARQGARGRARQLGQPLGRRRVRPRDPGRFDGHVLRRTARHARLRKHQRGDVCARPAPPANNMHPIWEAECTPGDTGAITLATMVYAAFTTGGANAWHYWWTEAFVPNVNSPPPQVYALGNFSKFVRPGYYRVGVTGAPTPSGSTPLVVAFASPADGTVAIVVVNGGAAQKVSFFVSGSGWPASVTPYVTSASSKLAAGTAITVAAGRFSASLDAQSVTTFVGKP